MSKEELLKKAREFVSMLEKEVEAESPTTKTEPVTPAEWSLHWDRFTTQFFTTGRWNSPFPNKQIYFSDVADCKNFDKHIEAALEWDSRARHANALAGWEADWRASNQKKFYPFICIQFNEIQINPVCSTTFFPFTHVYNKNYCQAIIDAMGTKKMKALFNIFDEGE